MIRPIALFVGLYAGAFALGGSILVVVTVLLGGSLS